jgi:NUMOD1 domain
VKVIDIQTNEIKIFDSIAQTTKELKISKDTILKYINKNVAYKNFLFEHYSTPL